MLSLENSLVLITPLASEWNKGLNAATYMLRQLVKINNWEEAEWKKGRKASFVFDDPEWIDKKITTQRAVLTLVFSIIVRCRDMNSHYFPLRCH